MPRVRGGPAVGQEPEPVRQARLDLRRGQRAQPRRGQLDRQRQPVQLPADPLRHRHRRHPARRPAARRRPAVQEQPHRRRLPGVLALSGLRRQVQRPHRAGDFTGDPQRLAAGRQDPQPRRGAQQRAGQPGAGIQQMLAVIQYQQQLRRPQPVDQRLQHRHITRLPHPQRQHHLRGHQPRIGDTGQLGQPHPVREPAHHPRPGLQGQPGLSRPAGPGQRDQPRLAQQPFQPGQVLLAAQEAGQRRGQVMPRRKRRRRNLLPQHRLLQPAQLLPRFQPQLGGQHVPGPPVGRQRISLPLGPVQRQHQQPPQPLPQRILRDQVSPATVSGHEWGARRQAGRA